MTEHEKVVYKTLRLLLRAVRVLLSDDPNLKFQTVRNHAIKDIDEQYDRLGQIAGNI